MRRMNYNQGSHDLITSQSKYSSDEVTIDVLYKPDHAAAMCLNAGCGCIQIIYRRRTPQSFSYSTRPWPTNIIRTAY